MEAGRRASRIDSAARAMDGAQRGNSPPRQGSAGLPKNGGRSGLSTGQGREGLKAIDGFPEKRHSLLMDFRKFL